MVQERQHQSIQWAKSIADQQPVILDTETTGLNAGEICQIAIVDWSGTVLLDTLVKPRDPIPPDATRIHGITNAMVENAHNWKVIRPHVALMTLGKDVIVYNSAYDFRMVMQTDAAWNFARSAWGGEHRRWHCAMERYAEYYGDWNDYRQSYRWQKLTDACCQCNLPDIEAPAHSALGDALRTLALVKYLASQ